MSRGRPPRFGYPQAWTRIRVPVVIAERCVQKVGTVTIPIPPGIPRRQDGGLAASLRAVAAGPAVTRAIALKDKVLNEGHLPVELVADDPDPVPCPGLDKTVRRLVSVPFVGAVDLPGVQPGDRVEETVELEGLQVSVVSPAAPSEKGGPCPQLLRITTVLQVCLVVERVKVIAVHADP